MRGIFVWGMKIFGANDGGGAHMGEVVWGRCRHEGCVWGSRRGLFWLL